MSEYPEHDKLREVQERSQTIGEFVEWLSDEHRIRLCDLRELEYVPTTRRLTGLLAQFFEIDLDRLEDEKLEMLDKQRALNEATTALVRDSSEDAHVAAAPHPPMRDVRRDPHLQLQRNADRLTDTQRGDTRNHE